MFAHVYNCLHTEDFYLISLLWNYCMQHYITKHKCTDVGVHVSVLAFFFREWLWSMLFRFDNTTTTMMMVMETT